MASSTTAGHYPIRTVSELTGVHPVTLRAWERRYGLIKPRRSAKGHRLYNDDDISLINEVVALLQRGISIGQARYYLTSQKAAQASEGKDQTEAELTDWKRFEHRIIAAIEQYNEQALDRCYDEALSLYPIDIVTERLLKPILRVLGERWQHHKGSIAEEHFFSTYMRNKLGARLHHTGGHHKGPPLIAACLPGEQHELGLLMFCIAAADKHRYRFIILGADTPLHDVRIASERAGAIAILLSGSAQSVSDETWQQLHRLCVDTASPVFVGGQASLQIPEKLAASGAIALGSDTASALSQMEQVLATGADR